MLLLLLVLLLFFYCTTFFFFFVSFTWIQPVVGTTEKQKNKNKNEKKWKKNKDSIKCKTNLRCKQLDTTPSLVTTKKKKLSFFSHHYLQQISRNMMVRMALEKCATTSIFLERTITRRQPSYKHWNNPLVEMLVKRSKNENNQNKSKKKKKIRFLTDFFCICGEFNYTLH